MINVMIQRKYVRHYQEMGQTQVDFQVFREVVVVQVGVSIVKVPTAVGGHLLQAVPL